MHCGYGNEGFPESCAKCQTKLKSSVAEPYTPKEKRETKEESDSSIDILETILANLQPISDDEITISEDRDTFKINDIIKDKDNRR